MAIIRTISGVTVRHRGAAVGLRRSTRTIILRSLRRVEGTGLVLAISVFQITETQTEGAILASLMTSVLTTAAIRIRPVALCNERGHQ